MGGKRVIGPRGLDRTLFLFFLNSANIYLYFLYAMRGGGKIVLTIFMILASTLFHFLETKCLFVCLFVGWLVVFFLFIF
jgi:hypothetical protein